MKNNAANVAAELDRRLDELVDRTLELVYEADPKMAERYGAAGRRRCREDIVFHYCTLTEAIAAEDHNIFDRYVAWGKLVLAARNIPDRDLQLTLKIMCDVCKQLVSADVATVAIKLIEETRKKLASMPAFIPSYVPPDAPFARATNRYLLALLSADRDQARSHIRQLLRNGMRLEDIFVHILERAQYEIGRLWQHNEISVAQEHFATATTELIIAELSNREPEHKKPYLFVGACASGDLHCVGIRMVTELLDKSGWRVYFTGANTPISSVVELLEQFHIDVLGISAATPMQLRNVRRTIDALRKTPRGKDLKVLVGGKIFNESPHLWKVVGADGYAPNAIEGVRMANRMVRKSAGRDKKSVRTDSATAKRSLKSANRRFPTRRP